jgi:hypothetical protein
LPIKGSILERPKSKAKTIALVLEGKSDSEVAAVMNVTRQAITKFRHRHAAEIAPIVEQVEAAIIDVALKDKENRIRELAWLYGLARTEAEEHGITITETRYEGRGEDREEYQTRDFRAGMVKEMRGLLADIADELGQRSGKGGDINIDNRTQVLVRQYGGFDLGRID